MPIPDPPSKQSAAWGKIRDALAAVHNLQTLLKSPRVGKGVLAALLPELHASCQVLRAAFAAKKGPRRALGAFAGERIDALEGALEQAGQGHIEARERLALEQVTARVSGELGAAVELLDLLERAEAATPTELSLEELARASLGIVSGLAPGEDVTVRVDTEGAECTVLADAHVVSRILTHAVARVRSTLAGGAGDVTVRARCEPKRVSITVAATTAANLPEVQVRMARRIGPSDAVVEAAARAIGGEIALGSSVVMKLPRA
jgi:hypothetical protein